MKINGSETRTTTPQWGNETTTTNVKEWRYTIFNFRSTGPDDYIKGVNQHTLRCKSQIKKPNKITALIFLKSVLIKGRIILKNAEKNYSGYE